MKGERLEPLPYLLTSPPSKIQMEIWANSRIVQCLTVHMNKCIYFIYGATSIQYCFLSVCDIVGGSCIESTVVTAIKGSDHYPLITASLRSLLFPPSLPSHNNCLYLSHGPRVVPVKLRKCALDAPDPDGQYQCPDICSTGGYLPSRTRPASFRCEGHLPGE